jgi:carbon-monoxide dehydrogenase large subunit
MIGRLIGSRVERVEDRRILTGRGCYVDDVRLPGMLHVAFLRSPHAHARIRSMDAGAARALSGVHLVLLPDDLSSQVTERMNYDMGVPGHRAPLFDALTGDVARYVGDPVAAVVADSRAIAEDACDAIAVDWEPLAPVLSAQDALADGATVVFEDLGDNVIYDDDPRAYDFGDVDGAFAAADRVVELTIDQHRFGLVPMEGRGGVADWDPGAGKLTYHASTQSAHLYRMYLARYLGLPQSKVRVLAGDVGGAFGSKWALYREDVVIALAGRLLGRPVKWIEDRLENLTALGSAREETVAMRAAVRDDGTVLALDAHMTLDHGSYPAQPPAPLFAALARVQITGALRIQNFRWRTTCVATHKNPYVSYRGPGSVETLARERLLDTIARELDLDPVEVRRRNFVTVGEQPVANATGAVIDRIDAVRTLETAVDAIGYEDFRERQRAAWAEGRHIGIGVASTIHPFPGPKTWWDALGFPLEGETGRVRIEPDGAVTAYSGQVPHGQGHETTLAQVVADQLGVGLDDVTVVTGDTDRVPFFFFGTGASKGATMASGSVVVPARTLRDRVLRIAAEQLEASPDDLDIEDGSVFVKGARWHSTTLAEIATTAYMAPGTLPEDVETSLEATAKFDGDTSGWSAATHICTVEVDVETGQVHVDRYVVAEDCGTIIHPGVVEGQIRGGAAQGLAGMLMEHCAYDDEGRPLSASLQDYLVPTAMEIPEMDIIHLESGDPDDPVPFRGVGEGGCSQAPGAVTNAVEDALRPFGVRIDTFPLTPTRILELVGTLPAGAPA